MQVLNHQINIFNSHSKYPVFQFESQKAPDIVALELAKRFPLHKFPNLKKLIVFSNLKLSHKRLSHAENLDVLFLFYRDNDKLILSQACIHHATQNKYKTFKDLMIFFKGAEENTFLLNFYMNREEKLETISDFLELKPVHIPKPWGQELWYSGIESRGISHVQINNQTIPLSWILGAFPNLVFGKKHAYKDPILLKILDPLPEPVKGDLYYELHLEKNEVYIVTSTHSHCGRIKIGVNPEKLKQYHYNTDNYKSDFLKSILAYESVRKNIDLLEETNEPVTEELKKEETTLREKMDSFCGYLNLNVGDVVSVPTRVPHALQHGVQVIEFQTPTYERLIISFAQKVLTQPHWDTKQAFQEMKMQPFQQPRLKILAKTPEFFKELVCKFQDFKVVRWTFEAGTILKRPAKPFYRIVFVISGKCLINNTAIKTQTCTLIPQKHSITINCKEKTVLLVCEPRISIS